MPIKDKSLYPADWDRIRQDVCGYAGWRCQGSPAFPHCRAHNKLPHPETGSVVVLTVAHLDHDPTNNDPANLRAWCQRCHNVYDIWLRKWNRAATWDESDKVGLRWRQKLEIVRALEQRIFQTFEAFLAEFSRPPACYTAAWGLDFSDLVWCWQKAGERKC